MSEHRRSRVPGKVDCRSLFKEDNHVVVDVQANVAVGLILHGEAATENDQAVPRLPEFVVELRLHILCDVRVVR